MYVTDARDITRGVRGAGVRASGRGGCAPSRVGRVAGKRSLCAIQDSADLRGVEAVRTGSGPRMLSGLATRLGPTVPCLGRINTRTVPQGVIPVGGPCFGVPRLGHPIFPSFVIGVGSGKVARSIPVASLIGQAVTRIDGRKKKAIIVPRKG